MTRYLVTDDELQDAIHNAIKTQDRNPQGYDYVIASSMNVVKDVLKRLGKFKVAESKQTENSRQDGRCESDTSEYPVIRLEAIQAADLVDIICNAYQKGKDYSKD